MGQHRRDIQRIYQPPVKNSQSAFRQNPRDALQTQGSGLAMSKLWDGSDLGSRGLNDPNHMSTSDFAFKVSVKPRGGLVAQTKRRAVRWGRGVLNPKTEFETTKHTKIHERHEISCHACFTILEKP